MDERDWTDRPLAFGDRIELGACVVTRGRPGALTLVSGDVQAALDALAPGGDRLGFAGVPQAPDHALSIGRDHALLVTAAPVSAAAGWHAAGFAVSPADGGFACFDLIGDGAADMLAQGLAAAPPWGSASAAVQYCGTRVLVSGLDSGLRLWVERGFATYVTGALRQSVSL